jgi:hypothetical protein
MDDVLLLLQHSVAYYSAARAAQQTPPSPHAQLLRSANSGADQTECARLVSLTIAPDDAVVVNLYSVARSAAAQHISSHRIASVHAASLVSTTLHSTLQTVSVVWSNGDWQTYECASLFGGAKPPKPSETRSLARAKQAKAKGTAKVGGLVRFGGSAAHSNSIVCGGGLGAHSTHREPALICCEAAFGTELWRRPLASAHVSEVIDVCPALHCCLCRRSPRRLHAHHRPRAFPNDKKKETHTGLPVLGNKRETSLLRFGLAPGNAEEKEKANADFLFGRSVAVLIAAIRLFGLPARCTATRMLHLWCMISARCSFKSTHKRQRSRSQR